MTKEMAEFLQAASENAGNECDIREDYSGRGMYGKTTHGVVVDSVTQLLADVIQHVRENIGETEDGTLTWDGGEIPDPDSFRTDNMAMQTIVY
jgi:hypothetical protein